MLTQQLKWQKSAILIFNAARFIKNNKNNYPNNYHIILQFL
jgi:hypothetical protein